RRADPRAHACAAPRSRRDRRDERRDDPSGPPGARGQHPPRRGPPAPTLPRGRVESHRPHPAGPPPARGGWLDGRRGGRGPPGAAGTAWGGGGGRRAGGGGRRAGRGAPPPLAQLLREHLLRFFPQLRDRTLTNAWGGPIDVSPTHLPIFGSRAAVHHGYGFT